MYYEHNLFKDFITNDNNIKCIRRLNYNNKFIEFINWILYLDVG